jgi:hypothetical protein
VLQLTDEILSKLVAIAHASGIDLGIAPDGTDIGDLKPVIPAVNLNRAPSEIAHETGLNLKDSGLYVYGKELVTVDAQGNAELMDADRFRTWIDQFQLNFYKRRMVGEGDEKKLGPPIKAGIKKDVATQILRSDDFVGHLPIIKRILPVRLPVWTKDEETGERRVRLLKYGYDQETFTFTKNTGVDYLEMWTLETAVEYLRNLLKDFPYGDAGRSLSVQVSAMLTTYCQLLFAERDNLPMIFFNANLPGSGKSRLAEMCIYPVYGTAEPLTYSDNDEFTKKLDSWAQNPIAYAFLDDVSGLVKNNDLNRWLTSPVWAFRYMHTQRNGSVFNQKLTLLTGNQATLSEDLTRRMFMVDLWSSELASDRQGKLSQVIDAEWLADARNRGEMLSAFYAMVKHWSEMHGAKNYGKQVPSFEGWSRIIPSIVTLAGFDCPLAPPNVQDAGGKQEVEFCRMLEIAARDYTPEIGHPREILLTDWCRLARFVGVFHGVISDTATMREVMDSNPRLYKPVKDKEGTERPLTDDDKELQASRYMDKSTSTKFGNILNKYYRGQVRKIHGRTYKFADREARHSTFALELLKIDPPGPGTDAPPPEPLVAVETSEIEDVGEDEKPPF